VGDNSRKVTLANNSWNDISVGTIPLAQGANRLKWTVNSGAADLAWIELVPADAGERAANGASAEIPR
jgi:hypothetical protein